MKYRLPCVLLLAAATTLGCRGIVYPSPRIVPDRPSPGGQAGEFTVYSEAGEAVSSRSFAGRPFIVIGASPDFAGDILPWVEAIFQAHGAAGEAYELMLVLEGAGAGELRQVERFLPEGIRFHLDPRNEFASSRVVDYVRPEGARSQERMVPVIARTPFGFVGEGPHLVAIAPDGTIAAIEEGPLSSTRRVRFLNAVGGMLGR